MEQSASSEPVQELGDLGTLEGAKTYVTSLLAITHKVFKEQGEVLPIFFILGTVDPKTGEQFSEVKIIPVAQAGMMGSGEGKDLLSQALQSLVRASKAVGIVTIMEAWTVEGIGEEKIKEFEALRAKGVAVSEMPDRKEAVMVSLEHCKASHVYTYRALITRDEAGNGTLGEFEALDLAKMAGRFAGFLHHVN